MNQIKLPNNIKYSAITVLTGAGISAESGLDTFRDKSGVWSRYNPMDVATPEGFERNPLLVHNFYNDRRKQLFDGKVKPNPAHISLKKLQDSWKQEVNVITTNIDNLHHLTGTKTISMHGSLTEAWCTSCNKKFKWLDDMHPESICPQCKAKGKLRVNVVWFNEIPYYMDEIEKILQDTGIFIVIGSSSSVYPAAGFVNLLPLKALKVEVNIKPTEMTDLFDIVLPGKASEAVPELVESLLNKI